MKIQAKTTVIAFCILTGTLHAQDNTEGQSALNPSIRGQVERRVTNLSGQSEHVVQKDFIAPRSDLASIDLKLSRPSGGRVVADVVVESFAHLGRGRGFEPYEAFREQIDVDLDETGGEVFRSIKLDGSVPFRMQHDPLGDEDQMFRFDRIRIELPSDVTIEELEIRVAPRLAAPSQLRYGSAETLRMYGAPANSQGGIWYGLPTLTPIEFVAPGAKLTTTIHGWYWTGWIGPTGLAEVPLVIPNDPAVEGLTLRFQGGVATPGVTMNLPFLYGATNSAETTVTGPGE